MYNLLYKELRLAAHPTLFVFTLLGVLVIVPSYPYGTVFLYGCLAPAITLMYGRETNDIYYTVLLPVRKQDVVKAKYILMVAVQMAQLTISVPFAILRLYILPEGNPVGIEANLAYYGFGLMIYGVFNGVFITQFFKTAYKVGKAFLIASAPALIGIVLMESIVHFPMFGWLDSVTVDNCIRQIPILLFGIVFYIVAMLAAYRKAANTFEQIDL